MILKMLLLKLPARFQLSNIRNDLKEKCYLYVLIIYKTSSNDGSQIRLYKRHFIYYFSDSIDLIVHVGIYSIKLLSMFYVFIQLQNSRLRFFVAGQNFL